MNATPNFESIKQINVLGREYWSARDLMPLLGYQSWQNFDKIIKKAAPREERRRFLERCT